MALNDCCVEGKGCCLGVLRCIADGTELKLWMISTAETKSGKIELTGCTKVKMHPSISILLPEVL